MKTNEFKKQVSELGFKALASNIYMTVYNDKYDIIGMISVGCPFVVDTDQSKFLSLSAQDRKGLLKLLVEYAETPLDEREDEKKYYVKVFNSFEGFLYVYEDCVMLSARVDDSRGQFTQEDIDELKQRYDIPLDWDKVKLIEVEDEQSEH